MKAVLALCAAVALSGCATTPLPEAPSNGGTGDDCAVIAAVAKEHYGFNTTDRLPPPVKFDPGFDPQCDWSHFGLAFEPYDEQAGGDPRERQKWVGFGRPIYDGRGASIRSGIMHGPLAGMGVRCRVISGFAGWTVGECERTWIS
jgi:hypothetical protein